MSLASELADLEPDLRGRVRTLIKECPFSIGITSAWRSRAEQQRLYDGWKARKPGFNPANPPGMSRHELTGPDGEPAAEAADLRFYGEDGRRWAHLNAHLYGLHFPIRREPWHVESNGKPIHEESDMTDDDRKLLREVHAMLTALGAPRRPDKVDVDKQRISLGDVITAAERAK